MKTLADHIFIYEIQNNGRSFTPKQRRRLFHLYRCRKCGAFGEQPCVTDSGKRATMNHRVRPA